MSISTWFLIGYLDISDLLINLPLRLSGQRSSIILYVIVLKLKAIYYFIFQLMFEPCLQDAEDVQVLWRTDFPVAIIHHFILNGSGKVPCRPGLISTVGAYF